MAHGRVLASARLLERHRGTDRAAYDADPPALENGSCVEIARGCVFAGRGAQTNTEDLMVRIQFERAIPVLPAPDVRQAISFYVERLGFSEVFATEDYAGVERHGVEIHFWECDDPVVAANSGCRVVVQGIDDLHDRCRSQGIVHPNGGLATKAWGFREFVVLDSAGNAITFAETEAERGPTGTV
jgi:catechol 2,3-dioxygenase-like lactoylglutathione lyase family enzyme